MKDIYVYIIIYILYILYIYIYITITIECSWYFAICYFADIIDTLHGICRLRTSDSHWKIYPF